MDQLHLPYDSHPAFQFGIGEIEIDSKHVEAFADAYSRLEETTFAIASAERQRLENVAGRALADVLDELALHGAESTYRTFVSELKQQCQRVLAADLKHFATRNRQFQLRGNDPNLSKLEDQKFFLGQVSADCVSALLEVAREPIRGLRQRAASGKVTRDDLSINVGSVPKEFVGILNPEFERLGVNRVVSAYAQKRMEVCGLALELSVPAATWWRNLYRLPRPPKTLYAHTDEGLDYPKSILYLCDVGERNGPMAVYPHCEQRLRLNPLQKLVGRIVGSVGLRPESSLFEFYARREAHQGFSSENFRRHFSMLPKVIKYNSHFGWDVLPDSNLEQTLTGAEMSIRGPAGTFAVFDGARLLHRGGLVEEGERIALQVIFSEPRSLFRTVASRLARDTEQTIKATEMMSQRLRRARARIGRTVQQFSFSAPERLSRRVARILPPMVCVDIGASYYPHPAWELFRRSSRALWIAVEPNEKNVAYLSDWYWPSKPRLEAVGLSEKGGEQLLYVTNIDSGSSLLPPVISPNMVHRVDHRDRDYFFPVTERRIQTKSLSEILTGNDAINPDRPVVVKLDTQGTELSILKGAEQLFTERRIVGIETEATLLAEPYMAGSGKFWEICQFLEARGFELLQIKPIEALPKRQETKLRGRTYLNECDAVFSLKREEIAKRPPAHVLALFGFYLSYQLFEEARSLFDKIEGIDSICETAGVSARGIRSILDS